jgi:hypothetical protein
VDEEDIGAGRGIRARERRRRGARVDAAHLAAERLRKEASDAGIR